MPPLQMQPKFRAQANRMITSVEAAEKIQHTPQKSATRPNYLHWQHVEDGQSGTQVGVCYTTVWSARTGSTPVKPSVSRLGDGQSDPVSLVQFPRLPNEWRGQCTCWGEGEGQVNDRWPAKSVNYENIAERQISES